MTKVLIWVLKLTALVALVSLTGCGLFGKKPEVPVTITKYVVVKPGDELTTNCPAPVPPEEDLYAASNVKQREAILFGFASEHQDALQKCNLQWKTLREWIITQEKIYEKPPVK